MHVDQDNLIASPPKPKVPRIENSNLESLRNSLKNEITSEIKNLLAESQKEMLNLLKSKTNENAREDLDNEQEIETRCFFATTKHVRINSTQNNDSYVSCNKSSNASIVPCCH